jgi:hypothetical protein
MRGFLTTGMRSTYVGVPADRRAELRQLAFARGVDWGRNLPVPGQTGNRAQDGGARHLFARPVFQVST